MEVEELTAAFWAVTMCDGSHAAAAAVRQLASPVMAADYDEPVTGEERCTVRLWFPDGRFLCKNFGATCPAAALFWYCHSVLVGGGCAAGWPLFRLVRLTGGVSDEIYPQGDSSLQDLGLHHSTIHVVFGPAP